MGAGRPASPTAADRTQAASSSLKLVLIYAIFAAIWILLSDRTVVWIFSDPAKVVLANTLKGWLFVAITSLLLYRLIRRLLEQSQSAAEREIKAQARQMEALRLLGDIADNSSDAIFAKDLEGRYLLINRETARVFGKPAEQALGQDDLSLFPQAQGRMLRANDLQVITDDRVITYEEAISTVDGERTYLATKGPLHDQSGKISGMFGISRDITEFKRAEDELSQKSALLESIFNGIPDPVLYVDTNRNVVAINSAFTSVFGYALADIAGRSASLFYSEPAEYERQGRLRFNKSAEEQPRPFEAGYRRKDGSVFPGETLGSLIKNATGDVVGYLAVIRDITERANASAALRQSEDRYRTLVEWSPEPIIVHRDLKVIYANPAASRLFGAASAAALVGKPVLDLVHPDYHQSWLDRLRKVTQDKIDAPMMERKLLGLDGTVIHAEVAGASIVYDGAPATHIAIRDISKQMQATQALAHEKALFESIFNAIPDAIVYTNIERNIVAINPGFTSVLGYTIDELAGKKTSCFYESLDEYEKQGRLRFNLTSKRLTLPYEVNYRKKNGEVFPGETLGTVIRSADGKALGYISVIRDIGERKRAEDALRESEGMLTAIFDVANVGVSITDASGKYVMFNHWWKEKLGYTEEELRRLSNVDITHDEDKQETIRNFREVAEGRVDKYRLEKRFVGKDKSVFWGDLSVSAIKDQSGRIANIVGMVTDITERKRAEAAQAQFELQLRESQKMEALGTLAGGVAHDFNNALATIIGNTELARQDLGPEHAAVESLEEINKASRRAKNLVQQILAFSRRQAAERRTISLASAVREAASLLRSTLPAGVKLTVECAADTPEVLADPTQIEQVVLNLCSNAWHALKGEARDGEIVIQVRAQQRGGARYCALAVRDNGRGMDEATQARIFEPFFTTKGVGEGTGLGLSVVHGIAKDHGASIEVHSAPGAGSTFVIYFPAAQPVVARGAARAESAAGKSDDSLVLQGEGKHVLYLDDDESIVFLMKRMLEREGHRVSGYTSPHQALAAARADPRQFDLAVTDYNMPGMSGLEVAQALREINPDLPVVLASGYITDELRQQAPAVGVRELVYKPNSVDELCKAVARHADNLACGRDAP